MASLTAKWPERPKGFYRDWKVFAGQVLSRMAGNGSENELAAALLAGGASLGGGGLVALVFGNRKAIDAIGRKHDVPALSKMMMGGSAILGVAGGGLGTLLVGRALANLADKKRIELVKAKLANGRREFLTLLADLEDGVLDETQHRLAVENLFLEISSGT